MAAAAFKATYSDWRVVKGRKVVQVVFELPLESSDEAYQVLGGMPIAASEKWFGIARLDLKKVERADRERRPFNEISPAQQAGMLSNDRAFRLFLAEKFDMPLPDPDEAASVIRHHCKVKSRAEIKADNADWSGLVLAYRLWQREPEFVDA